MGRRYLRHPDAVMAEHALGGRAPRAWTQIWGVRLVRRVRGPDGKMTAFRGRASSLEEGRARLQELLAWDVDDIYSGGWVASLGWTDRAQGRGDRENASPSPVGARRDPHAPTRKDHP